MLKLVTGRSGSGKTTYARQLASQLARDGKRPVLIVPEQYSFATERYMLERLGAAEAHKIDVLSFTRLAEYVSRQTGERQTERLDRCARAAAMSAALGDPALAGELVHYNPGRRRTDLVLHLLDAVIELKQCAVTVDMLKSASLSAEGILGEKLGELAKIYAVYDAVTQRCDPLDTLDILRENLSKSELFKGRTVIFDSFKGFTGQEFAVIGQLMRQCDDCIVCLYADKSEPMGIFEPVADTASKLVFTAKQLGVKVAAPEAIEGTRRFENDALRHLESSVFRRDSTAFEGNADNVTIYTASTRHDEMEFCARECRRLVREKGLRYRDIAVIARNDTLYCDIARDAFDLQELALFFDRRADIESSALIRLMNDALTVAANGRNTDDMLRIAKSGLVKGITREDAFETENYCLIWGVRGSEWKDEFEQNPDGLQGAMNEARTARLEKINSVRKRVEALTAALRENISGKNGRDMAAALFRFAEDSGVREQLDPGSDDDRQIWKLFVSLLDRIASVLGDSKPTNSDFAALFALMCSLADIGHIPQGQDEIVFSSPERFRPGAPKAVFIVGAADGEFPANPSDSGVFTDDERIRLIELGLPVSQPFEHRIMEERLLAYTAITCASEYVYITYPEGSSIPGDEVSAIPSELVGEVLRCLPTATQQRYNSQPCAADTEAPQAAFELLARSERGEDTVRSEYSCALSEELSKIDGYSGKIKLLEEMKENKPPALSAEAAGKLFGKNMAISPTAAENYHHCRFRYFCQNALSVKAMQKAQTAPNFYGTLLHYVFEKYLSERPEGDIISNVKKYVERYVEEELGGEKGKNPRLLERIRSAVRPCAAAVRNLLEELACCDFKPVAFELRLGSDETKAVLPDGSTVAVKGTVDRVDTFERGGKTYLRVIDYKTGSIDFRLSNLLEGLNMQMLMYLGALCDGGRFEGCIPAGVLYCPSYTEDIPANTGDPASLVMAQRDSKSRRKGMIIDGTDDLSIANAMEHDLEGRFLPVSRNGDKIKETVNGHIVSPENFTTIRKYIRFTLSRMAENLRAGRISPDPDETACEWCDFAEICRFEGDKRKSESLDAKAALEVMKKQMGAEEVSGDA